jgi:hypothetical protein
MVMVRSLVAAMRRSTRRTMAEARRTRRRQVHAFRDRLHRQRLAVLARVQALLAPAGAPENGATEPDALRARVLDLLAARPHGVGAQAMGNELGVDWRRVASLMSELVARGAADQIEQTFYPNGKASRR